MGYQTGFSDHTVSQNASLAALTLGARVIEKHVTINKKLKGPDHKFSLSLKDFNKFVLNLREMEKIISNKEKKFDMNTQEIIKVSRKSIVSSRLIKKNSKIVLSDLEYKRPGTGISPLEVKNVIGKIARVNISENRVIKLNMIKKSN